MDRRISDILVFDGTTLPLDVSLRAEYIWTEYIHIILVPSL